MNSLKKGKGVPLLNFVEGPGVPLLNFEGGSGVPLLNFREVPGPTFKLWGGSRVPGSRGPGSTFTSCRPEVFLRKSVLKICSKFTGKHLCWSVISIKLLCNLLEITFRHGCSCVNLLHIFITYHDIMAYLRGCSCENSFPVVFSLTREKDIISSRSYT